MSVKAMSSTSFLSMCIVSASHPMPMEMPRYPTATPGSRSGTPPPMASTPTWVRERVAMPAARAVATPFQPR